MLLFSKSFQTSVSSWVSTGLVHRLIARSLVLTVVSLSLPGPARGQTLSFRFETQYQASLAKQPQTTAPSDPSTWRSPNTQDYKGLYWIAAGIAVGVFLRYVVLKNRSGKTMPGIRAHPSSIRFGKTLVGNPADLVLTLSNRSGVDAVVDSLSLAGDCFSVAPRPKLPLTLPPGSEATLTIVFHPVLPKKCRSTLKIGTYNRAPRFLKVSLKGKGIS